MGYSSPKLPSVCSSRALRCRSPDCEQVVFDRQWLKCIRTMNGSRFGAHKKAACVSIRAGCCQYFWYPRGKAFHHGSCSRLGLDNRCPFDFPLSLLDSNIRPPPRPYPWSNLILSNFH
ncbi:hypothetical protein BaRGS_00019465 [Batillaria attramentaria]|uniref:Uncharacterized protein n=1 Tax=Batillaria attramentaria TaxID=370345 RepID=A0ABD0KR58_9CAEN